MTCASSATPVALESLVLLLAGTGLPSSAAAQQPVASIRAEALEDFHGPDETGKDGPLAKAGLDLLMLYHEHQAFQQRGGDTFSPSIPGARVSDGHVSIDAIAANGAGPLRADLNELGLKDAAVAGRIVSGRLPIDQIPAMATLESLRGVALSRMKTHEDASGPTPMAPQPEAIGEPSEKTAPPEDVPRTGGGLPFLLGILGVLLLIEL